MYSIPYNLCAYITDVSISAFQYAFIPVIINEFNTTGPSGIRKHVSKLQNLPNCNDTGCVWYKYIGRKDHCAYGVRQICRCSSYSSIYYGRRGHQRIDVASYYRSSVIKENQSNCPSNGDMRATQHQHEFICHPGYEVAGSCNIDRYILLCASAYFIQGFIQIFRSTYAMEIGVHLHFQRVSHVFMHSGSFTTFSLYQSIFIDCGRGIYL